MKNLPSATQDVNVVNTATNPVPVTGTVQNAENPARNAVQQELNLLGGPGSDRITIPAGKIFVLETVSYFFNGGTGATAAFLGSLFITVTDSLITGGGQQGPVNHFLVMPPPNSVGIIQGSQALRLYAQPGTTLVVNFSFGGSTNVQFFDVSLSGYFVNAQ